MVFFLGVMLPVQVGINARLGMGGVLIGSVVVLSPIITGLKLEHFLWSEYCCGSINCFDSYRSFWMAGFSHKKMNAVRLVGVLLLVGGFLLICRN